MVAWFKTFLRFVRDEYRASRQKLEEAQYGPSMDHKKGVD